MTTLLITSLAVLSGVMLIYSVRRLSADMRKKRKHLQIGKAYDKLVQKHRLIIDHAEILHDKVIALDRTNKLLLVVNHAGNAKQEYCIPLLSVARVKVKEQHNQDGSLANIILSLQQDGGMTYEIEFFNHSSDAVSDLTSLNRKALNWKHRVDVHSRPGRIRPEQEYVI